MTSMSAEGGILRRCEQNSLTINEYFTLFLMTEGKQKMPSTNEENGIFLGLASKGFIDFYPGTGHFELLDKGKELFATSFGDELYEAYPAAFPLSGGSMFIARTGGDKGILAQLYHSRINNSREEHEFAMKQLHRYIKMVKSRKINGYKLVDWITNSLWHVIAEIPEDQPDFKTDL